ncbi:MAG: PilC/PilY family type IV pilus protein [Gammaproteobacteria bacterium]|nr:PilC/PilY family type IV pilus protein [Gammaproteobacteria bacterium]MDH3577714.1 PilC/PilY family type IV pilus protein [Gammaproteobacteria bacterium]
MKTKTTHFKAAASAALLTCTLLGPVTASAAPGTLADTPLFLSNSVEPNILFMLDDSGSMDWGLMTPENNGIMRISCDYHHVQPASDIGSRRVLPTEAAVAALGIAAPYGGVWRGWSKDYNRLYYDPTVTYTPWAGENASGSPYTSANPTATWLNPYVPGDGTIDLTATTSYTTEYCPWAGPIDLDEPDSTVTVTNFYPARYNIWIDSDADGVVDADDAHTLVEIKPTTLTYVGGPNRRDCAAAAVCTYAEEIQNFANWYAYYRKRAKVAKAAYGQVMAGASNSRMGLATLHNNGSIDTAISSMNPDPTSGAKGTLLDHLYTGYGSGGTPLRNGFDEAGKYLSCKNNAYFNSCPALPTASGGECQQNFTILMTDGYYNGSFNGNNNEDGDDNTPWDSGTAGPYGDSEKETLADIAMEYYENDIRPGVANNLRPPPGGIDENTAQHMVTYSVAFGVDGTLTAMPPNTTDPFTWPVPDTDAKKIDDLRHAAWNGRGEFLSAQNPGELIAGLRSAIQSIQGRVGSAASVAFNTGSLSTNSQVYLALFNSERWDGSLLAFDLDPNTGAISASPSWSAAHRLNARDLSVYPRTLLTHDGADGIAFQWSALTAAQKNDFRTNSAGGLDNEATGMARHGYMRGDRGCESSSTSICNYTDGTNVYSTKALRERGAILGDLVHSGPVFVGAPESNWPDVAPFPGGVGTTYSEYRLAEAARPGVIYVGGNDGMLHGFAQASGNEILGYIPNALYSTGALDGLHYLTDPAYAHRYTVDLTPSVADAYIKSTPLGTTSWKTVLVGGLRGGGRGLFALDVTNPALFSEALSAPAKTVMWEFTSTDDADLGHTFSRPSIVPLEGPGNTIRWAAIVGNGYNDLGSGQAKLFVLFLEGGLDGTWTSGTDYIEITTGVGTAADRNGLSTPAVIDSDGDGLADRVYAGDLKGNMWAFDLAGTNTGNWNVAYSSAGTPKPLFTAPANQQITSTPVIVRNSAIPTSAPNSPNTMVVFGTGQYLTAGDVTTTDTQTMYGVWDSGTDELNQSDLVQQTIGFGATTAGVPGRTLTTNAINFATDFGWYMNLPDSGERLVTDPVIRGDLVFFNTMIPDANPCNFGGSGWLMAAKWLTGGNPGEIAFDLNRDGLLDDLDEIGGQAAVGVSVTGIATSPVNLANKRYTSTTETTGGSTIDVTDILDVGGPKTGRLAWEELTP